MTCIYLNKVIDIRRKSEQYSLFSDMSVYLSHIKSSVYVPFFRHIYVFRRITGDEMTSIEIPVENVCKKVLM
jgi:hypothetical protein